MRLNRLDLTRYGCFTDFSIDFGEGNPGIPDIHIVYGPNESGKSTLVSGCLDLLFGIEKRSPYNFIHDYRSMRIGAQLRFADGTYDLARIKRDNESLLDLDGHPTSDAVIETALGSIDRVGYKTMFSLDDETLESGGEDILRSEGNLGQLLFAATSGLSGLSTQLSEIKSETDKFYKPRGRTTELKQLKDELFQLKDAQAELDTNARVYADLVGKEASARQAHTATKAALDQARLRYEELGRVLEALPRWASLRQLRQKLDPLKALPDPPPDWAEEAQALSRNEASASANLNMAATDVERLIAEVEGIEPDEHILELQAQIQGLKDLESRYRAAADIPLRENERKSLNEDIADLAVRLGTDASHDPRRLLLPAATIGAIEDLIDLRTSIAERVESAKREHTAAADQVELTRSEVEELGEAQDVSELQRVLEHIRSQELRAERRNTVQHREQLAGEFEAEVSGLIPWQGAIDALASMRPPEPGRIDRWHEGLTEAQQQKASLETQRLDLVEKIDRLNAQISRLTTDIGAISDEHAHAVRATRDEAWQAHTELFAERDTGDVSIEADRLRLTADSFESAMAEDDHVAELRMSQTDEIARLRHLQESLASESASLAHVEKQLQQRSTHLQELDDEMRGALEPLGLPGDMDPRDFKRWLERRESVLLKQSKLVSAQALVERTESAIETATEQLTNSLSEVAFEPDSNLALEEMLEFAQAIVDQSKESMSRIRAARKNLVSAEQALARRSRAVDEARAAQEDWESQWREAIAGCWLGETDEMPSTAEVRAVLRLLGELPAMIAKRDELTQRIEAMQEDRKRFVSAIDELCRAAKERNESGKELDVLDALRNRLGRAMQNQELRQSREADLEHVQQQQRDAQQTIEAINTRKTEMCALFAADDLNALIRKLSDAKEKVSLVAQIDEIELELMNGLRQPSLAETEALLADIADDDEDKLESMRIEHAGLRSQLADEEDNVSRLYHEWKNAESELNSIGGDAEVARMDEQRQAILLEIQEKADRHLRLKVGTTVAEQALRLYRDRHRSSMMIKASDAFRTITRGRFSKLETVPENGEDILVGVQAGGGSLIAYEMSKGTRFQLYLALRIAGYHEFAAKREPLPFIADDIMETFDDDRSRETFQLLGELARTGQVIYLTHHAHLCEIAREVCGDDVTLHQLPDPLAT